jgi:putative transposase
LSTIFASLADTRLSLADWMIDYNTVRPHGAIGNLTPTVYAKLSDPGMQRSRRSSAFRRASIRLSDIS